MTEEARPGPETGPDPADGPVARNTTSQKTGHRPEIVVNPIVPPGAIYRIANARGADTLSRVARLLLERRGRSLDTAIVFVATEAQAEEVRRSYGLAAGEVAR